MKVKKVFECGRADVYNMTVDKTHNFAVNGGLIVHNCDALRYYAIWWREGAEEPETVSGGRKSRQRRVPRYESVWTASFLEDYYNADEETQAYIRSKYGEPPEE